MLAHSSEGTQEVAQSRPDAFHGVAMHFANAIAIVVTRPFAVSWSMVDRFVFAPCGGQMVVGFPFIGVNRGRDHRFAHDEGFEFVAVRMPHYPQADLPAFAPYQPGNGRAIVFKGAVAPLFVSATPGRIQRIEVRNALLPGILIHFVGFQDPIR